MNGSSGSRGRTADGVSWRTLAVVFAAALAVRLAYLAEYSRTELFRYPVVDAQAYDEIARGLASEVLTGELFWQPSFYPLFLGAFYAVGGPSVLLARLAGVGVGAVTCALTCKLGGHLAGRRVGLIAGLGTAFYGPLIQLDAELLGTGWACFWSVALTLTYAQLFGEASTAGHAGLHVLREPSATPTGGRRVLAALAVGVCTGLAVLAWPPLLPFMVVAPIVLALRRGGFNAALASRWTAVAAGALLVVIPLAAVAGRVTGRTSFLPAATGLNLWIGNNPERETTVAIRPGWDWEKLTDLPLHDGVTDKSEMPAWFVRQVVGYATSEPLHFLGGLAQKTLELVSSRELPRNVDPYQLRERSWVLSASLWKVGGFGFPFGVLLPLAAVGFLWHRPRTLPLVATSVATQAALIVLAFVSGRYRAPLIPLLWIAGGAGWISVSEAVRARRWNTVAAMAGVSAVLVVLSSVPGPFPQERTNYRAELEYLLGRGASDRGDRGAAIAHLERAVEIEPAHADALTSLAALVSETGDVKRAHGLLDRALAADPDHAIALANYARVLAARGERAAALEKLEAALEVDPFDPVLIADHATALTWFGREAEALAGFQRAYDAGGRSADLFTRWGRLLLAMSRPDEAEAKLELALATDPLHADAVEALAAKHLRAGQPKQAAEIYARARSAAQDAGQMELARRWEAQVRRWSGPEP